MRYARIYPWRRTRRFRAPSNGPEAFFVAQFSAGYTTNMFGFDLRQAQVGCVLLGRVGTPPVVLDLDMSMYQKGWSQPPEYFQARTKYLQLADKATRTVLMLTERLDHHRGRGQQQIVVKHVTVNADQAMVAETITTRRLSSPILRPFSTSLFSRTWSSVAGGETEMSDNPMHRCNAAPRSRAKSKRTGLPCGAPAMRGYQVCRMHRRPRCAPGGKGTGIFGTVVGPKKP